jgi:hypothetical protein
MNADEHGSYQPKLIVFNRRQSAFIGCARKVSGYFSSLLDKRHPTVSRGIAFDKTDNGIYRLSREVRYPNYAA